MEKPTHIHEPNLAGAVDVLLLSVQRHRQQIRMSGHRRQAQISEGEYCLWLTIESALHILKDIVHRIDGIEHGDGEVFIVDDVGEGPKPRGEI